MISRSSRILDIIRISIYTDIIMSDKVDIKFSALLDKKTYERLRKESYINHVSISMIIRKALSDLFLKKDLQSIFKEEKNDKT